MSADVDDDDATSEMLADRIRGIVVGHDSAMVISVLGSVLFSVIESCAPDKTAAIDMIEGMSEMFRDALGDKAD